MKPTGEEIRTHSAQVYEQIEGGVEKEGMSDAAILSALLQIMQALWEIAAQQAEKREKEKWEREIRV